MGELWKRAKAGLAAALKSPRMWITTVLALAIAAYAAHRMGGGRVPFLDALSVTAAITLLCALMGTWVATSLPGGSRGWQLNFHYAKNYGRIREERRKGTGAYLCSGLLQLLIVALLLLWGGR